MNHSLTIAQVYQLQVAFACVARGFPANNPRPVIITVAAKLACARNLHAVREALVPANEQLNDERARLLEEQNKMEGGDSRRLTGKFQEDFDRFTLEMNAEETEVNLIPIALKDLDLEHFEGGDAIEALATLDSIFKFPDEAFIKAELVNPNANPNPT